MVELLHVDCKGTFQNSRDNIVSIKRVFSTFKLLTSYCRIISLLVDVVDQPTFMQLHWIWRVFVKLFIWFAHFFILSQCFSGSCTYLLIKWFTANKCDPFCNKGILYQKAFQIFRLDYSIINLVKLQAPEYMQLKRL